MQAYNVEVSVSFGERNIVLRDH